jgi:NitT/TauT family transport system ATP-binding protein
MTQPTGETRVAEAAVPESGEQSFATKPLAMDIRGLTKSFGQGASAKTVLGGIDLTVRSGELLCIVGPSGAGKTTLLRCMSGLSQPTSGEVQINGVVVDGPPESLAVVFQDYSRSLFPWMKVRANVEFPLLEKKDMTREERSQVVDQMLAAVGLTQHADKYPRQLSGGMQQRVAIARALAYRPTLLLMDEPFASLDAQTRAELEDVVLQLRAEFGVTIVFVTHDIDEAVYLGDKVAVLSTSPARVAELLSVELPSPRDQASTKAHPEFSVLRTEVLARIREAQAAARAQAST